MDQNIFAAKQRLLAELVLSATRVTPEGVRGSVAVKEPKVEVEIIKVVAAEADVFSLTSC